MAKFELKFIDEFDNKKYIKVEKEYYKEKDVIHISGKGSCGHNFDFNLDKSTAIKFAKTLRTEINKITESEGNNG